MKLWTEEFQFISLQDEVLTFKTETNTLNGNQMWWFDERPWQMFYGNKRDVKGVIKDIKESCKVI